MIPLHVAQTAERRLGYGNHVNANIHNGPRVVGAIPSVQSMLRTSQRDGGIDP